MKNFYSKTVESLNRLKSNSISRSYRSNFAALAIAAFLSGGIGTASAQISLGSATSNTTNVPVTTNYGYTYSQQIFLQSEIVGSGEITSISFKPLTSNPSNFAPSKDWVVYLGHTAQNNFESTTSWVPVANMTQVFSGEVVYPTTPGGLITINFTTPFTYNNTDNLVIAVDENASGYGTSISWQSTNYAAPNTNRALYYRNDTNNPDPATPPAGSRASTLSDVILGGIVANCPVPTNVVVMPTPTSAVVSWTAATTSVITGYEYEVRSSGAVGSGAEGLIASGTAAPGVLSATVSGLTADSSYTAYVRSNCSAASENSFWVSKNFRTGYCLPSSTEVGTYINSFSTTGGTETNISNLLSGYTPTGYQDNYATQSITTFPTATVQASFVLVGGTAGVAVWIDLNNDYDFSNDERIYTSDSYLSSGTYSFDITVPANTALGSYRMRVKTDYNATNPTPCNNSNVRTETEDYKVIIVAQASDVADYADITNFTAGLSPALVTSIQSCQSVEVSASVTEAGLTDTTGENTTIAAWIGHSLEDTDPATWPESAWTIAEYSADAPTADVYSSDFETLEVGTHYFASRFRITTGPYAYGAQGGIWNATTNTNAVLTVETPAEITFAETPGPICAGGAADVTVSSTNANYNYIWMPGELSGATQALSPASTTLYTVTGTDSITGCTSTATVTVTVSPTPEAITITEADMTVCENTVVELNVSASSAVGDGQIGTDTTETTNTGATGFPNPFNAWYGGARNQMVYTKEELETMGLEAGSSVNSIGFEISAVNGTKTCNDFTIKIASTTLSSLTEFVTSSTLTTVYNQTFTPTVVGPVSFNFTAPFIWDGVSNIIVETTHNAGNYGNGSGTKVNFTATGTTNTSYYATKDNVMPATAEAFNAATGYATSAALARRPNTIFGFVSVAPVNWSPIEGLFTDAAATVAYVADANALTVYAKPATTTTYTASASTATCSVTDSVVVTITPAPDAPMGVSPQAGSTIADLVVTPTTLVWWYASEADALTGENPLESTTPLVDGATYFAVQISAEECRSAILEVVVDFTLANQSNEFASLKYYPNPVTDQLNISFSENITAYSVFNMIGQQVISSKVNATTASVDMSSLPSGSYMLQIETANASKVVKLIKQ